MNKAAPKEPSMDEILSSIRQIIADDDAAVAPRNPAPPPPVAPIASRPAPAPVPVPRTARDESEPLALTPAQMLRADPPQPAPVATRSFAELMAGADSRPAAASTGADDAVLVDPDDVTFASDDLGHDPADAEPATPVFAPSVQMAPPPIPRSTPVPPPSRPAAPSVARAAPMPDPQLSSDMAEQLLAPTTDAAVKHAFTRLNGMSMQGASFTIEDLMRDMLRPMLKEWLDENLPSVVERMVEKEIARVSRGGE